MPKFQRRHYQVIADVLAFRLSVLDASLFTHAEFVKMADTLADAFAADNDRFDRAKFLTACGL